MIYFLCFLLFLAIRGGKGKGWQGVLALALIDIALLLSILRVGGYI